jgi:hypothetical protein
MVLEARLAKLRARLAHSPARVLVRFDHVAGQTRITASRNARGLIAQLLQVRNCSIHESVYSRRTESFAPAIKRYRFARGVFDSLGIG